MTQRTQFDFKKWMADCGFQIDKDVARRLGIPERLVEVYREGSLTVPLRIQLLCEKIKAIKKGRESI